jgi:hypothetical protein
MDEKIPIKITLYFRDESSAVPKRIEIEIRKNVIVRLPPDYYDIKKKAVYNPISKFDMFLRQFPVMKVYKRRLFNI